MSANSVVLERLHRRTVVPWRVIPVFMIVLVIVGLHVVISASARSNTIGVPEFTAPLLDGTTVRLSDYRGQVVMLNFWATWCAPCRAEMPMLQTASDRYYDQGFVILAVNDAESPQQIQPFVDRLALRFPIVLDEAEHLQRLFGVMGYPTSVFIRRDGVAFATQLGALSSDQLTAYIEAGLARPIAKTTG